MNDFVIFSITILVTFVTDYTPQGETQPIKNLEKIAKRVSKTGKRAGKVAKAVKSDAKSIYKKAKNGRVYKMVGGRPRFVSKAEARENGFD